MLPSSSALSGASLAGFQRSVPGKVANVNSKLAGSADKVGHPPLKRVLGHSKHFRRRLFDAHVGERSVQCSIAREALERYFWAPVGASDAQLLKSYVDGRKRIEAIVCRKLLATQGEAVGLSMSDFAR